MSSTSEQDLLQDAFARLYGVFAAGMFALSLQARFEPSTDLGYDIDFGTVWSPREDGLPLAMLATALLVGGLCVATFRARHTSRSTPLALITLAVIQGAAILARLGTGELDPDLSGTGLMELVGCVVVAVTALVHWAQMRKASY